MCNFSDHGQQTPQAQRLSAVAELTIDSSSGVASISGLTCYLYQKLMTIAMSLSRPYRLKPHITYTY
ncbi:MAG: hypothetical protein RKO24_13450, partial [Candidatus Competibacter sp.]|nr:hypothetical protein [Candidatus Competibacter sp.]